jgi:methionyl-tRNA formyltransferase
MILKTLVKISNHKATLTEQNEKEATYTSQISKENGIIDWNKSAIQIEREIRTYSSWPKSYTTFGSVDVEITKAHAVPSNDQHKKPGDLEIIDDANVLTVETTDGYLCIEYVKPAGKKEMPIQAFLSGYRSKLAI